jgi:hypothetical protein
MLIKELVHMDELGEFRYDVQLSDYENPKLNRDLLRNYIFTVDAPTTYGASQRDYSAKDVLDLLIRAFTTNVGDYRVVLTANYGHGKSHLALTLANFFARPPESPEIQIVMQRLEQALNQPSQLQSYREFKQQKGEFLVIRLQGDRFDDLQEGFLDALDHALREHPSTKGVQLPFWYQKANDWLHGLYGESRQKAEAYLAQRGTDIVSVTHDLRKSGSYELIRETFRDVVGVYPDFGGEINLKDLIVWTVNEVCIPKKMGGVLILFDEFSLFLQKYSLAHTVGKLQELLNGINDCIGKCAFLAFSQQDVDTVAETYAGGQRLQDVRKELERLPKDKRGRLFSLMESVLASYLKQDDRYWESWQQDPKVKPQLAQAREIVLEHFGKHYNIDIKWNPEAYTEKVVKGCYPLHPLTTAILATHNFETGTSENPRTALQFVRHAWENISNQLARHPDGKPNFIYPIALVEFFGEQISKKWYAAYQSALESPNLTNLTDVQRKVLQALFLQYAVGLKASSSGQLELLSHLSGLSLNEIKSTTNELGNLKVIQFDPYNKVSYLWPVSTRPHEIEEIIKQEIEKVAIDWNLVNEIANDLPQLELSGEAAQFGAQSDWKPHQYLMLAEHLTEDKLQPILASYQLGNKGFGICRRGGIVWLVAQTDEERLQLRQKAQSILDQVVGSLTHPLPLVMVLPVKVIPHLIPAKLRLKALEKNERDIREKIGGVFYQQERAKAEIDFRTALNELTGGLEGFMQIPRSFNEFVIPAPYRAAVQALNKHSLQEVISECYRQAYPYRISFYNQYAIEGKGSTNLRKAVMSVVLGLFNDQVGGSLPMLKKQDVQYQLITEYLENRWGLLSQQTLAIRPPIQAKLKQAWEVLEECFPPGCNEVRASNVLFKLLSPPYGHDVHTLTILLTAWIGYHRHEIRLSMGSALCPIDRLKSVFAEIKTTQEFLDLICINSPLYVSRFNPDELFGEIKEIIEQIKQNRTFTLSEARIALAKLEQAKLNPSLPPAVAAELQSYQPRLQEALEHAEQYDKQAQEWLEKFHKASVEKLVSLQAEIDTMKFLELVQPNQPIPPDLRLAWEERLETDLKDYCSRYAALKDLIDYKEHESKLKTILKEIKIYPHFVQQVQQAVDKLNQRKSELEQKEKEKPIIAEINSMSEMVGLAVLYQYQKRLAEYKDLSPEVEQLRQSKSSKVNVRIAQFEQLAQILPEAIDRALESEGLNKQKTMLLKNLELVQETPLYESLLNLLEKIGFIEGYFDRLKQLDYLPKQTPAHLENVLKKIDEIGADFNQRLSQAQLELIVKKRMELEAIRMEESQKAQNWLQQIALWYKQNKPADELLSQIENCPPYVSFLSHEHLENLEKFKQVLKKKIEEDLHLKIISLYKQMSPAMRRKLLEDLMKIEKGQPQ